MLKMMQFYRHEVVFSTNSVVAKEQLTKNVLFLKLDSVVVRLHTFRVGVIRSIPTRYQVRVLTRLCIIVYVSNKVCLMVSENFEETGKVAYKRRIATP